MVARNSMFRPSIKMAALASVLALGTFGYSSTPATAQSLSWFVYSNCTVNPCMVGVAQYSYAVPNNQRYREGWRKYSGGYNGARQAWRAACRMYYTRRFNIPDIYAGRVNCPALGITGPS